MSDSGDSYAAESPVTLEINANHRYKADEMGVIEFRIRNQSSRPVKTLDLTVACPCERSKNKSALLTNLLPSVEKKPSFQFEPARGGEALLEIEIRTEDADGIPLIFRGQTSVSISSKNEGAASHTSFTLDIHDIQKFMGNDLSNMIAGVGKDRGLDAGRLHERMESKEPFWMRVDLDVDEGETLRRRAALRRIIAPAAAQMPARTERASLASLNPSVPHRIFIYSMPEVIFGREPQRSDAVLRFLPDSDQDPRSVTISAEQFLVRCRGGHCTLSLAPRGRALMSVNRRLIAETEEIPIKSGTEIKIGSCEFTLRIACAPRSEDPRWKATRSEIFRFDPSEDPFQNSPWDCVGFSRPANGREEEYLWLLRKMEIGWEADAGSEVQFGFPVRPRAHLGFWNGRYYLEAAAADSGISAAKTDLLPGKILCLDSECEIAFGPHRFQWKLL